MVEIVEDLNFFCKLSVGEGAAQHDRHGRAPDNTTLWLAINEQIVDVSLDNTDHGNRSLKQEAAGGCREWR